MPQGLDRQSKLSLWSVLSPHHYQQAQRATISAQITSQLPPNHLGRCLRPALFTAIPRPDEYRDEGIYVAIAIAATN
jgi:hypothetical protein